MKRILALVGRSTLAGIVLAVTFCAGVALLLGGAAWWIQRSDAGGDGGSFVETFVAGVDDAKSAKVVRVEISGEIGPPAPSPVGDLLGGALGAGDAGGVDAFNAARDRIRLATCEKDVKGLYLVIDSPGGDLTDSDLLWHDVQLFREALPGRFVFVHALAQCCSGGYYVAAAADFIMVVPTGEVGSIGPRAKWGRSASSPTTATTWPTSPAASACRTWWCPRASTKMRSTPSSPSTRGSSRLSRDSSTVSSRASWRSSRKGGRWTWRGCAPSRTDASTPRPTPRRKGLSTPSATPKTRWRNLRRWRAARCAWWRTRCRCTRQGF